nr:transposase [Candidatus Sigynarchaeota archaeon]
MTSYKNLTYKRSRHHWKPSYFTCTTGRVTLDTLEKYVESQGEK